MKILANKEIKNLFLSLSLVFGVTFLLAEVFLWLSYRRLSLLLLILFLLAGGAVWAVCFVYFNRQNQIMEQAILQINAYLDGDRNARIECDNEGELYRLLHSINSLAAVLNAHKKIWYLSSTSREPSPVQFSVCHFVECSQYSGAQSHERWELYCK